ncbi:MAG: FRG domain-containing protein [Myxococcota bacterium]
MAEEVASTSTQQVRVSSWGHLQEELFAKTWDPTICRFRSTFVYRGLPDAGYKLLTSLSRTVDPHYHLEGHLLRNFRKYGHTRRETLPDTVWHWLTIGQHHGLPTRLLDWTYSPYVALHFATNEVGLSDRDAIVWVVDYVKLNKSAPRRLRDALEAMGSNVYTTELLHRVCATIEEFDTLDSQPFALFFEPPSLDERIINQYALFSMLSDPAIHMDDWLKAHPAFWRRIIIPHELRWEIRDKLDQANITERVLFPGLDGLSAWLRRHYTPLI